MRMHGTLNPWALIGAPGPVKGDPLTRKLWAICDERRICFCFAGITLDILVRECVRESLTLPSPLSILRLK